MHVFARAFQFPKKRSSQGLTVHSSSFTFWSSQFASSSRSNWTSTWIGTSNGTWSDKQSSHFRTVKEITVKATFFFILPSQQTNLKMMLKWSWNHSELVQWFTECQIILPKQKLFTIFVFVFGRQSFILNLPPLVFYQWLLFSVFSQRLIFFMYLAIVFGQIKMHLWLFTDLFICKWWIDKCIYSRMEPADQREHQKL